MSAKLPFGKILPLQKCLEKKPLEILISERKPSGAPIVYTEQNCLWYLTISAGTGTRNRIKALANYTLGFGKNTTIGCWRIGGGDDLGALFKGYGLGAA